MSTVWRIGDPLGGLGQFRGTALTDPDTDEVVIAVDDPGLRARFPQIHPGPLAAYAGGREKHLVLTFDLPGQPTRGHRLTVKAFAAQGPVPELEIEVNGHKGLFFPTVQRDDRRGVPGVSAISGWIDIVTPIDPKWLLRGENRLTVTTTSATPVESLKTAHPELPHFWGSALTYATITLDEIEEDETSRDGGGTPTLSLRALPLYIEAEDGLAELADVIVSVPVGGFGTGSVTVEIGRERIDAPLELRGREFGQARARFEVPEQEEARPARVTLWLDGRQHVTDTTFRPCRKWTLHLMPHVHLDLGYTDHQGKVSEIHTRNIDRVLDILKTQPDYAYSVDGSYVVDQYLRTRDPDAIERLRTAAVDGQISVNALYTLFLTGLITLEECFRAGRHAADLRRDRGLPVDYANLTDVPSYSGAMPTVLRAMGIDAFLGIQNHGRAANDESDELHLSSPFRWYGPDGAEVLTFFSDCYAQLRYFCGYPVSVQGAAQSFTRFVSRFEREDYLPLDLPIVGIYSDNEDIADGEADFVARWSKAYAYPKLRFSTVADYFAAVRPLRDKLPVVRGDGGSYWEDGVGAGAAVMARYRRAQIGLAAAETVATLVSGLDRRVRPALDDLDRAWDALLVGCEHTWTWMHANRHPRSHQAMDQLAWKEHHVATAERVATDETRRSLSQLGELVTTDGPTLLVVNTLGWERDVDVEIELTADQWVMEGPDVVLIEAFGDDDGLTRARLTVKSVPAFGYRAVPVRAPEPADTDPAPDPGDASIDDPLDVDTGSYRLRLEHGRVTSLWSRAMDRELLDVSSRYGLGEVIYVRGGDPAAGDTDSGPTALHNTDPWLPEPDLEIVEAQMRVTSVRQGKRGTTLVLSGHAPTLPRIEVEFRFRRRDDRVDVAVRLDKEAVRAKESVYVAFPFAVPGATARYDRQAGWVDPTVDHLPGACNEWFTTLFGVGLENAAVAVHWTSADAPLFTLNDVVRGRWSTDAAVADGTILSWAMNNYWWTNFPPSQEGTLELRYAFRPADSWNATEATRFGREVRSGASVSLVGWMDKMDTGPRPLPRDVGTLLHVEAPSNVVTTVVAGRVESGCVVRLQEVEGARGEVCIGHPGGPGAPATLVSALEDPMEELMADDDGVVRLDVEGHAIVSVRLGRADGQVQGG